MRADIVYRGPLSDNTGATFNTRAYIAIIMVIRVQVIRRNDIIIKTMQINYVHTYHCRDILSV